MVLNCSLFHKYANIFTVFLQNYASNHSCGFSCKMTWFWKMFQQFLLIYWKSAGSKPTLAPNDFYYMDLKKQTLKHFSKYILLCSTKDEQMLRECSFLHLWSMFMHVWFTFSFLSVLLASLCIRWAPLMSQSLSASPWRMKKGHVMLGNSLSIRAAASISCIPNEMRSPPW